MIDAPQSSPAIRRLPAFVSTSVIAISLLSAPTVKAQERELATAAELRGDPAGVVLGRISRGSEVATGRTNGAWIAATLRGWIFQASVGRSGQRNLELVVAADGGENLRASPNGPIIARLQHGTLLDQLDDQGAWVRVERSGWILRSALATGGERETSARRSPAGSRSAEASGDSATGAGEPAERTVEAARSAPLHGAPGDSAPVATLEPGARARVMSRAGEWTRVRVEGWVRESELKPADEGALLGVTAAEVRSDPGRYVGTVVEWRVQFIAVQTADELRPELPPGRPYVLARGPLPETGFVYIQLDDAQLAQFRALPPLAEATIRATIRAPRTKFLATPVVELVTTLDE